MNRSDASLSSSAGVADESHGPLRIEDYALIGDCTTAALVGINGSIDWLCWPRFDSGACLAALLGHSEHGRWSLHAIGGVTKTRRFYQRDTMVLETLIITDAGEVALIDFMPMGRSSSSIVRIVEGRAGCVRMRMNLKLRFDYGSSVPWVSHLPNENGIVAIAGRNLVVLRATVALHGEQLSTAADFEICPGERVTFCLAYGQSHKDPPGPIDCERALSETLEYWREWSGRCSYHGGRREIVMRSLLTLKALTFGETGAIVAAPTTSLPEQVGGRRNWDYRYCWVRDATLTLTALMGGGYYEEARAWRDWLHRSVAGTPEDLQIMYGIFGERRLPEWNIPWLPGYQRSAPVRVGNAASGQLQLDVWGEMMDALHLAREGQLATSASAWALQCKALEHLALVWHEPDDGIWEVRGPRRHFTHSKIMAWVAFDRAIRDSQKHSLPAPLERWCHIREEIRHCVLTRGFHPQLGSFTQSFDSDELDASLLLIAQIGFLPIADVRVRGTIAAIESGLLRDGLVMRYRSESGADGLPPGEGIFLPCSFWLVDAYNLQGRHAEAEALLERLMGLCNDVGLLSEEYDPDAKRLVGNFPQAFSHLALVQSVLGAYAGVPLRQQLASSA